MRRIAIAFLAVGLAVVSVSSAFATTLLSESFTYADGNLVPNGGWANFSGTTFDIQVASGAAFGMGPNANDDHLLWTPGLPAQPITVPTYACFKVRIPDPLGAPKPIYFAMLKDAGTSIFVARTYVLPITGGFTFGISNTSTNATTNGATPWSASTLLYETDYVIAIKYDPTIATSTLWVNPADELSPSVTNTTVGVTTPVAVQGFGLRQSASASTFPPPGFPGTVDWNFTVDDLSVGTSFADACGGATPTRKATWGEVKSIYRH
jgi:hypothetical protein